MLYLSLGKVSLLELGYKNEELILKLESRTQTSGGQVKPPENRLPVLNLLPYAAFHLLLVCRDLLKEQIFTKETAVPCIYKHDFYLLCSCFHMKKKGLFRF